MPRHNLSAPHFLNESRRELRCQSPARRCRNRLLGVCAALTLLGAPAVSVAFAQDAPAAEPAVTASSSTASPQAAPAGTSSSENPEARPLAPYRAPRPAPAGEDAAGLVFSVAGKLALVLLVIFACAAGWKMVQVALPQNGLQSTTSVQVTSTVALASQRFLHLVTIGQQRLLLASSPQQIAYLGSIDGSNGFVTGNEAALPALGSGAIASLPPAPQGFDEVFQRLTAQEQRRAPVPAPPSSLFEVRSAPGAARGPIELGPSPLSSVRADDRSLYGRERDLFSRADSSGTAGDASPLGGLFHVASGPGGAGTDSGTG